jgi:hypothetical protein
MRLTAQAWRLRLSARQALGAGALDRALRLATEAQKTQACERGEALSLLAAWLKAQFAS